MQDYPLNQADRNIWDSIFQGPWIAVDDTAKYIVSPDHGITVLHIREHNDEGDITKDEITVTDVGPVPFIEAYENDGTILNSYDNNITADVEGEFMQFVLDNVKEMLDYA